MPSEWLIEKFHSKMQKCPICGSTQGFWINYGISNTYIQCKNCGLKTQFYHISQIEEKQTEKGKENWKSAIGLIIGVSGLLLVAFGLIFGTLAEFPFSWIAWTISGIIIFAAGFIITILTENERVAITEKEISASKD